MPETYKNLKTVFVEYMCDECGEPMYYVAPSFWSWKSPDKHLHKCVNGHEMVFDGKLYPLEALVPADWEPPTK